MIVSLFTLLTSTLLPMLGAANGTAIVGGSLIGISILSVSGLRYALFQPDYLLQRTGLKKPEKENWELPQEDDKISSMNLRQG